MASSVSRWKSSKSTCMVFTNVDADMVWAAMAAASRISSSVAPKSFAASVWKSVQYLHRVAPDTASPISSLYLFGIVVSPSWKSRMVAQNPSSAVVGISSTHPGTFPNACWISSRILATFAVFFSTVAMGCSFSLREIPVGGSTRAHPALLGAIERLPEQPVVDPGNAPLHDAFRRVGQPQQHVLLPVAADGLQADGQPCRVVSSRDGDGRVAGEVRQGREAHDLERRRQVRLAAGKCVGLDARGGATGRGRHDGVDSLEDPLDMGDGPGADPLRLQVVPRGERAPEGEAHAGVQAEVAPVCLVVPLHPRGHLRDDGDQVGDPRRVELGDLDLPHFRPHRLQGPEE